jgi:hypothetical protein
MIKQLSSFLMLCLFAQISIAQTSEKQNLKLDTNSSGCKRQQERHQYYGERRNTFIHCGW